MGSGVVQAIAHVRRDGGGQVIEQQLSSHLHNVGERAKISAGKLRLGNCGCVLGLLHDLGKASKAFQDYIRSAEGLIDPDTDEYVDSESLRGRIDHSTAGAQFLFSSLSAYGPHGVLVAELLALCLVSHHSGLIDGLSPNGADCLGNRLAKSDSKTRLAEALENLDPAILKQVNALLKSGEFVPNVLEVIASILNKENGSRVLQAFQLGMVTKFLFSCLIDADRLDSADFISPRSSEIRFRENPHPWSLLVDRLETALSRLEDDSPVNEQRRLVSMACRGAAQKTTGLFTLTVPTGGGKTLASLRFALHHAQSHGLERVIYVIPYTSIIDQNAQVVRRLLELEPQDVGSIVLEHHSNLLPANDSWRRKLLSENWDAPIVFTTMVQFLEAIFASGTRNARRFHQMTRSVLIFDEIQTLNVRHVHLFNNAIRFLTSSAGSSAVLCTATQPLLGKVNPEKGSLDLGPEGEIVLKVSRLFEELKRVSIFDRTQAGGWSAEQLTDLVVEELSLTGSVLVIVNTKGWAQTLFRSLDSRFESDVPIYHLSTAMCPAHRIEVLDEVRQRLDHDLPVVCISTQLIEAGVDVDFGGVIRFLAGLDSIAQAAGRCNRNGRRPLLGRVNVVNPADENLGPLPDIRQGREITERILREFKADPGRFDHDLIGPKAIAQYFHYYFWKRQDEMDYPVSSDSIAGRKDSLLNLLSTNGSVNFGAVGEYVRKNGSKPPRHLCQAFMTASKLFLPIDATTQGILVPWKDGADIINFLLASEVPETEYRLIRRAQRYSVNVYPHQIRQLTDLGELAPIGTSEFLALKDLSHYSDHFGLSDEKESLLPPLVIDKD